MHIPYVYIFIAAELLLILLGVAGFLLFYVYKLINRIKAEPAPVIETETTQVSTTSYIDYLQQNIEHNELKSKQQAATYADEAQNEAQADGSTAESPPPDEAQSQLLEARNQFLTLEKTAAEHAEHETNFWENIYTGMQDLLEQFKVTETKVIDETSEAAVIKAESDEKVFYIETQGKKIDGEVNKLKDIIFDQENHINGLRKAMKNVEDTQPEPTDEMQQLVSMLDTFEQQVNDAKMCMDVLELENERLQKEVAELEIKLAEGTQSIADIDAVEPIANEQIEQIKDTINQQESQISDLNSTIDELRLDADQAEKLKSTVRDFAHSSSEMLGCISILEDENERLSQQLHDYREAAEAGADKSELQTQVKYLEQEIIKKDVAYAQLQDEYSSIEKEYMSMYAEVHGDNE